MGGEREEITEGGGHRNNLSCRLPESRPTVARSKVLKRNSSSDWRVVVVGNAG